VKHLEPEQDHDSGFDQFERDTGFGKEQEYGMTEPRQRVPGDVKNDDLVR
jgi:hypothetical protein